MDKETMEAVWQPILDELATLQDKNHDGYERPVFNPYSDEQIGVQTRSSKDVTGVVINPVCGSPITFDTACAANVFATEYRRTGEEQWRDRARRAIEMVRREEPYSGVNEPRWDPVGWHFAEGSLSVTGTVLDALWDALETLEEPATAEQGEWNKLGRYLDRCHHGMGRFAHNIIPGDKQAVDVQNTTAFAYFLRRYSGVKTGSVEDKLQDTPSAAVTHLGEGQRLDGFWPYICPGSFQKSLYRSSLGRRILETAPLQKTIFRGDSSILFGDSVHHCYVLYYLLRGATIMDGDVPISIVRSAWEWIERRLTKTDGSALCFNFSWEPSPDRVRFCNFYDVTTYFLILATLPLLQRVGVIEEHRVREIASGITSYIGGSLIDTDETPCLPAHECGYEHRRRILPAVWGGTSLKGSLFARYLRYSRSL